MSNKLYVGNLPYTVTSQDLEQLFSSCGKVVNVLVPTDKITGNTRGFAFVEFSTIDEAEEAILQFHQNLLRGRHIIVTLALEKAEKNTFPKKPNAKYIGTGECIMCHTTNPLYGFESAYNGICPSCISSLAKAVKSSRSD